MRTLTERQVRDIEVDIHHAVEVASIKMGQGTDVCVTLAKLGQQLANVMAQAGGMEAEEHILRGLAPIGYALLNQKRQDAEFNKKGE